MDSDKKIAPSLVAIAWVFLSIAMQSFGGGMTAWIRREIVTRRRWMGEQQFVGGLALSQIAPGANSMNLAVFVGTTLRGAAGALAALLGILLVPVVVISGLAAALLHFRDAPGVNSAMAGLGFAAIGLNAANGVHLCRFNLNVRTAGVMVVTAVGVGVFGLPLLPVLVVMMPIGLLVAGRR